MNVRDDEPDEPLPPRTARTTDPARAGFVTTHR